MADFMEARIRVPRVFVVEVPVTGHLELGMDNWPPMVQDTVFAAMERCMERTQIKEFNMMRAYCKVGGLTGFIAVVELAEKLGEDDVKLVRH